MVLGRMKLSLKGNDSNTLQALWIALGGLASFGFTMISSMILSRYFEKEDYGTYKQVLYVYHTLLTVFTLGLPRAFSYFLPRVPLEEAKDVVNKINRLLFIIGCVFSLLLFVFSGYIASILENENLSFALKIFSPVPMLMLPTMGLEGILSTYRTTQVSAIYTVLTRVLMLLCVSLPVIFFKGDYLQAIIGFVIASFFSCIIAMYMKSLPFKEVERKKTQLTYKTIISFTLPLMLASIWGIIISSSDQFFISKYFGTEVFAEFSNGSLQLPFVGMLLGASASVLTPVFSRKIHMNVDPRREILPLWTSVFKKNMMIIYPLVLFSIFFAEIIMVVLYGDQYANSGKYFQITLILNFFTLASYAPLIIAMGATRYYSNVHLVGAIILVICELICVYLSESPYMLVVVSMICHLGRITAMLYFIAKYLKVGMIELFPLKTIIVIIIPSILFLSLIKYILINCVELDNLVMLVAAFILYIVIYGAWSLYMKIDYYSIIKPLIKKMK